MKKKIIDKITKDFTFSNKSSDLIELKFLKNVSKTPVYLSKKTGLVFHNKFKSSLEVLEEWSQKIILAKWIQKIILTLMTLQE